MFDAPFKTLDLPVLGMTCASCVGEGQAGPVRWRRTDSRTLVIPHDLIFHIPGCGLIDQLGLFDDAGQLVFSGPLKTSRQASERPEVFEFTAEGIRLIHGRRLVYV